ncbi:hypothetical protein Thermo_00635 [Thermoplasmatales archaeon]|nr:hypothetical protein Thermo_00635 [Thermoplasmatales archaeon]
MTNRKKGVMIASILVMSAFAIAITGVALEKAGTFDPMPFIGVQVFDGQELPLVNASVQGIMYNPPDKGPGTTNLFVVNTNKGGYASIENLTPVRDLVNEWVKYQGAVLNSVSHPDLLLLITYHDSSGTFLSIVTRAIIELEHHDNNIIEMNRYIKSMQKADFTHMEVYS